jgi:hypothetical protein
MVPSLPRLEVDASNNSAVRAHVDQDDFGPGGHLFEIASSAVDLDLGFRGNHQVALWLGGTREINNLPARRFHLQLPPLRRDIGGNKQSGTQYGYRGERESEH